ncbi:MAG: class I SAM-dependent methyltransferase [Acidimicrobiia bacterium]
MPYKEGRLYESLDGQNGSTRQLSYRTAGGLAMKNTAFDSASVKTKVYDSPVNDPLVSWVCESGFRRHGGRDLEDPVVVDIGCGAGSNLQALSPCGIRGVGVTLSHKEAAICRSREIPVIVSDASRGLPFRNSSVKIVIASHVLEHLADPWATMSEIRRILSVDGSVFAAIPNVVFVRVRLAFLRGRFRYEDSGILDRTHLRFFDLYSARALFKDAGFEIVGERHQGWVPAGPLRRIAPRILRRADAFLTRRFPNTFAHQFLFEVRHPLATSS